MEREKLVELWEMANVYSVTFIGEYLVEHDGDDNPPAPRDAEIIAKVIEYFKNTM